MKRDHTQIRMPGFDDLFKVVESEYLCSKCGAWFVAEAGQRLHFCEACIPEQLTLLAVVNGAACS